MQIDHQTDSRPLEVQEDQLNDEGALVDEMIAEEDEIPDGITEEELDEIVNEVFALNGGTALAIPDAAAEQLQAFADNHRVPLKTYLEAVLHYIISTERRPGSWEGSQPFEFRTYDTRREEGKFADRWF